MIVRPAPFDKLEVARTESLVNRGGEWSAATHVWLSRPVVGTGPETFAVESPRHRTPADAVRFGLRIADKPHNLYLEYLSSTGVIGLAAFAFLVVSAARVVANLRRSEGGADAVVVGLVAVGVAYLVSATFSFDTPATTPLAFAALGGLMAAASTPRPAASPRTQVRRVSGWAGRLDSTPWVNRVWVAITLVVAVTLLTRPVRADLFAAGAERAAGRQQHVDAQERIDAAIALAPWQPLYRAQAAELAERWASSFPPDKRAGPLRIAASRAADAVRSQPSNVLYLLGLARAQSSLAAATADREVFEQAEATWRDAIGRDRHDWQLINEHALSLNDWANVTTDVSARRQAVRELEKVVAIKPDYRSAWVNLARLAHNLGDDATAARAARRALDLGLTGAVADELRLLVR